MKQTTTLYQTEFLPFTFFSRAVQYMRTFYLFSKENVASANSVLSSLHTDCFIRCFLHD